MTQDDLFDQFDKVAAEVSVGEHSAELSVHTLRSDSVKMWQEVPAALFHSWSLARQMRYCADRDFFASAHAASPDWAEFYMDRAVSYMQLMHGAKDVRRPD